jgi:hypothetical protein
MSAARFATIEPKLIHVVDNAKDEAKKQGMSL